MPLLAFGLSSPFAAILFDRQGLDRAMLAALTLIATGVLFRSAGSLPCLYAGTALLRAGIACGNVLLPGVLKGDFPERVPTMTGTCTLAMGVAAALASSTAVPVERAAGWQLALATSGC